MKNKLLYIIIALLMMSSSTTSQNIQFMHDKAGNRTSRLQAMSRLPSASRLQSAPSAAGTGSAIQNLVYSNAYTYTLNANLPVGSIPYTFKVNPNGSSAFSIPLSLPQGQAGLTPNISISYNSLAGEGILGYGMNLSCISSITRCGQRSFYDGANSAVSLTAALFELDGMRLIKNGSANNYLKEVDDFSRITPCNGSTGSPEYFVVNKKDGTKLYYGNYNGSNAVQKSSAQSAYIAWYLAAQEDANGNYISYQYEQDVANADVWLTSITYTLNANHSFQHENKILFSYQRYAEAPSGYISGCPVKRDKILKEITVKTDDKVMCRYELDYMKPTDVYSNPSPRLFNITRYGEGGTVALNPMRIEWGSAGQHLFNASTSYSQNSEFVLADFNGDGCMDLLTIYDLSTEKLSPSSPRDYLAVCRMGGAGGISNELTINTFTKQSQPVRAVTGDFNGDGLDDVFFKTSTGYEYWQTSLIQNNNTKFTKQSYKPSVTGSTTPNIVAMADVDGDGKDELVIDNRYYKQGSTGGTTYSLSKFSTFHSYMIGDVDGDGCQDIIVCDATGKVKVSSPARNAMILEYNFARNNMFGPNCVLLSGYFNDDRYLDFLMIEGYGPGNDNNTQATVHYSKGDGKTFTSTFLLNKFNNNKRSTFRTGDFNGDGLTDVVCVESSNIGSCMDSNQGFVSGGDYVNVRYAPDFNKQSSSLEEELYLSQEVSGTPGREGIYSRDGKTYVYPSYFYPIAADFSGDGKCDVVNVCEFRSHAFDPVHPSYLPGTTSLKMLCLSHQGTADVVTGIKNGDGSKRDIGYRLTTTAARDPKFYNGMYASWNKDIPTFNTAKTVKLGSLYNDALVEDKSYRYTTPIYLKKATREFQGFTTVLEEDARTGLQTKDYYTAATFNYYPYYYLRSKEVLSQTTCIYKTDYTMSTVLTCRPSTIPYYGYIYLKSQTETDNLKGTAKAVGIVRDANGNVTTRTTTYNVTGQTAGQTITENMEYVTCSAVSSFPNRVSSYQKTHTNPSGSITESKRFTYDSKGNMLTETEHGMQKLYTYDAKLGTLTSCTLKADNQNRISSYEYDDARYIKKNTDPVGLIAQCLQDAFGNPLSETTPDGRTTTHQYDEFGRLKKSLSHEQVPTEYRYVWTDHSLTGASASQYRLQQLYDGVLNTETTVDCHGRTVLQSQLQPGNKWTHLRTSYNSSGQPTKEETLCGSGTTLTPLATTTYTYDSYLRPMQENHRSADGTALNKQVYYTYDKQTETRRTVTDKENTETLVYDAKWNLISHTDAAGTTQYTYDAADHVIAVASPGYPMTATYNAYGLCTGVSNAAAGTTSYTYNGFDELATRKDANNNVTTYTYDLAGRITKVADGDRTLTYSYNSKGQLASEGVAGHQSAYTYTPAGLLQREVKTIKDQTLTKSYTYDAKGRLLTYTSPSGLVQKSAYDAAHNLISITDNATSTKLWEAKSYNDQGLLSADVNCGNKQTTYTYDQMGRYTGISNALATFSYQYNRGGLLTQRTEKFSGSGLTETFAYDAGEALISATLTGKTPVTVAYNNGRAIKAKSDIGSYAYTAAGAPLTSVAPVTAYSAPAQQLSYHKNNLPGSIAQGGYTRTYEYAANDQRGYSVLTTSSPALPFAAGKRYYFDDFERNINTANGAITDLDYIFADGRPVALVRTTGGSKTCYGVMTDRLGSLMSLYTTAGITQKFSYDAWGNRRNPLTGAALSSAELASANSITTRGYTGHEHIDEFALINMNARIYDAKLGMFISVDPQAGNYFGTYPYAYCGGDPLNRVDLTGEDYWSTNDTETINNFWRWYNQNNGKGAYDFNDWYRMSDDEFRAAYDKYGEAALTYNDQTSTLYSSYGRIENGEVVIYGMKMKIGMTQKSDMYVEEEDKSHFEGWEHFIGPTLIGLGQPIRALKPIGALGSKPGSSLASYTLSKLFPQRFTTVFGKEVGRKIAKVASSNTIGRAIGRSVPYIGYLLLGYDVIHTSWNLGQKYGPFTLYQNYQRNKIDYKSVLLNEK